MSEHTASIPDEFQSEPSSEGWRSLLITGHAPLVRSRHLFRYVPSSPRCKGCNNPFGGVGGRVFKLAGFRPSRKNPNLCTRCCDSMPVGGAEVDTAILFADVRGSTGIGEHEPAAEFARLLSRFYEAATKVLLRHDAVIDKLIGDEVMAFFVPGIAGANYRQRAVSAGIDLLRAVGYGTERGPWVRLGVAVNAGVAYVGNVGSEVVDFTALGDSVNVAARMRRCAESGQLLVRAGVADELTAGGTASTLTLRGREQPIEAFVLTALAARGRESEQQVKG